MTDLKIATNFVKHWEGFRSAAYQCSAGIWTIGYGTTRYWHGEKVAKGQTISQEVAEYELAKHLNEIENDIKDLLTKTNLNENQMAALISFVYNVGLGAFASSTLLVRLDTKNFTEAANEILKWNKVGKTPIEGLTKRRKAERELFLK